VGIGLTVVRDMTMALDGMVAADSQQGQGSVFTVKLPCRHFHDVKERFDAAVEPLVTKLRPQPRRLQDPSLPQTTVHEGLPVVLVVEDHVDVARQVGLVLGDKYNVYYASDGEQGIAKADELVPDLIITDVKMPLLDGLDMCRYLRQNSQLCHIPVIMLSARNSDRDRLRGIEAGADAYMVKPFVPEELRAWVTRLLENRQLLRDVFAAPEQHAEALSNTPENKDVEDSAKFLAAFARELDKQFVTCARIDLDKVARYFKMGENQLRRKIQALTGKSAPSYIGQLRMEKAMRLLKESSPDTLIGTIAEQCGFQDVAYFSRVFRQHYDMTPTQARNGNGNGKS
jgi:DNA-binding response OmpR family regulator